MSLQQESLERVLVLSENAILCEGLKGVASKVPSWRLAGECTRADELIQEVQRHDPTILLVGFTNADENEVGTVEDLANQRPDMVIFVLDSDPKPDKLLRFLQAGARGYFSIDVDPVELTAASRLPSNNHLFTVDAALAERFVAQQSEASLSSSVKRGHYGRPLTPREQEMLQLLMMGMTNQQIADTLSYSLSTVKNLFQRLFTKLGVENRLQAALVATGRSNGVSRN